MCDTGQEPAHRYGDRLLPSANRAPDLAPATEEDYVRRHAGNSGKESAGSQQKVSGPAAYRLMLSMRREMMDVMAVLIGGTADLWLGLPSRAPKTL